MTPFSSLWRWSRSFQHRVDPQSVYWTKIQLVSQPACGQFRKLFKGYLCQGPPRSSSGSAILQDDSQDSACTCTRDRNLLQQKETKQKEQREKVYSKVQEKPQASFQEFTLNGWSQSTHSITPTRNFDTHEILSTSEARRIQCWNFLLELVTQAQSGYHVPKLRASRKAGIHIAQSRHSHLLLSFKENFIGIGNSYHSSF